MSLDDLAVLPKVRDSLSFLYLERGRIEQDDRAVVWIGESARVRVPAASLTLLMLGPGTTVTHRAIATLAESGCLVAWTGEEGVRFYAQGLGQTRSSRLLLAQAGAWHNPAMHLAVVRRMYSLRFPEPLDPGLHLNQIRGHEGVRVREAYACASREFGVPWSGRSYRRGDWRAADPVNRALSAANACLYGICHSAIVALGLSPALGFVHTGKQLSFVYDVADLYKTETSIPAAFRAASRDAGDIEADVRRAMRDEFHARRLLPRIAADLIAMFPAEGLGDMAEDDPARPGYLWDPDEPAPGGVNYEVGT